MKRLQKSKIVIVDNSKTYRNALTEILESDMKADVKQVADAEDLLSLLSTYKANLIIYDLFSGSMDFGRMMKKIQKVSPDSKLIVLSFETDVELVAYCQKTGAAGFIEKGITNVDLLIQSLKNVCLGFQTVSLEH
jgi:two-component system, NarL family, response regulator EvgA